MTDNTSYRIAGESTWRYFISSTRKEDILNPHLQDLAFAGFNAVKHYKK